MGLPGNTLIREISEIDEELRIALEAAERSRDRSRSKSADDIADRQLGVDDRHPLRSAPSDPERTASEARSNENETGVTERSGETARADRAKQHVARLEELQREADEKAERDRGEFER